MSTPTSITTYTGTVTTTGEGRNGGRLRSSDGLLEHRLAIPAELAVVAGGTDQATVQGLAELAHTICPYSKAITGNVPVVIVARVADQAA